jgi:gluconolactonase
LPEQHPLTALTGAVSGCLVFSDIPASRQYWWRDGVTGGFREGTGQANGNTLGDNGDLLSCEHQNRRVSRTDATGKTTTVVAEFRGNRLNSPNDVVMRSDGLIFFTDPPYGVTDDQRELGFQGIYCYGPGQARLALLNDQFVKPNGLAFSLDESELLVADTERGVLEKFQADDEGRLSDGKVFCECPRPDGLRLDQAGNVWVACLQGVEIFSPQGQRIAGIELPERPANLVFGDADGKSVYICARSSVYRVRSDLAGAVRP